MTPYTPDLDLSPLPTKCCAACIFFGYPAANDDRQYGKCRYDAPKPGGQEREQKPITTVGEFVKLVLVPSMDQN